MKYKISSNVVPLLFLIISVFFFFRFFLISGKLPIPSDTIVGLYHPFRDVYVKDYPNGIPFKNFLITDPIRQQYPWKNLAISIEKKNELPLWNPYSFAGIPLLANFQTAAFYPLNIVYFLLPFYVGWSFLVMLQPILASMFLFMYLRHLRLHTLACVLGGFVFGFSGFFVAWMEWGTIAHTLLWLPLLLLATDKIYLYVEDLENERTKAQHIKSYATYKKLFLWSFLFIFSLVSSFFAGHLQTFFYVGIVLIGYIFLSRFRYKVNLKIVGIFLFLFSVFFLCTAVQWFPTLQFIAQSARDVDQINWQKDGWFIPWQHLIQFIAPDFFGNPATLNYWGVWNYGEFIGYIGIVPFILSFYALFFRHDKKTLFFGILFFLSLIFSLPTILSKLPYIFHVPFLSTSQPTRLLAVTDFSLAILSAFGFDRLLTQKKGIIYPYICTSVLFLSLWFFVFIVRQPNNMDNFTIAKHNLLFSTIIFLLGFLLTCVYAFVPHKKVKTAVKFLILGLIIFDLFRFSDKFLPFTNQEYLYPKTRTVSFLQKQTGYFRIMSLDSRIFPPNFSVMYRLQSVEGYDPLYLKQYGELIAASERGIPNTKPPFGFNRIITPHNGNSKIINLLGVKYVLSLDDIQSNNLKQVFQEGQVRVYENRNVAPRAFFVKELIVVKNQDDVMQTLFAKNFNMYNQAIVTSVPSSIRTNNLFSVGEVVIESYTENNVRIKTVNKEDGYLIITDMFYPTWHAYIDKKESKMYQTDYAFRGIFVSKGKHTIEFQDKLF